MRKFVPALFAILATACADGNGAWEVEDGGTGIADGSAGGNRDDGATGGGGSTASGGGGGKVGGGGSGNGGIGGSDAGVAANPDSAAACVPESFVLATVGPSGGSACSFSFNRPYTPGAINLVLTPGWGTVCHAGSSQNCGRGASADGWWISGGEIALCDATCNRFYAQTIAGKLTVKLGCPTETCTH